MSADGPPDHAAASMLKSFREKVRKGDVTAALADIRLTMRRYRFAPEELEAVGRLLQRITPNLNPSQYSTWRVRLAGQCTTSWIANCLRAIAWREGILLDVSEAEFDNVLQDVDQAATGTAAPDIWVFVPWLREVENLPLSEAAVSDRLADEKRFWGQVWNRASTGGARIVQVGWDVTDAGPGGYHLSGAYGPFALARRMNESLRHLLPPDSYFLDLQFIAGETGRSYFYDPRRHAWTKQPLSEAGCVAIAEHLTAAIRAVTTGPKKVLVVDLDNTLWGGVVGEVGPQSIAVGETPDGEAFRRFQKYLKGLSKRGVVLAVASKNNPEDAREPFRVNSGVELRLDDFACFEAHWEPKPVSLQRIADELKLGLDHFVFFDDSPVEREEVRQRLPQVTVVDVPADPADFVRALEAGLWFETVGLTVEDRQRNELYRIERQRQIVLNEAASVDDYLASLQMTARVDDVSEADLARIVQLIAKTNQFNLTTRRHATDDVRRLLGCERSVGFTVRLADRFGDYGLIAVLLAIPISEGDQAALEIDTWLMSCRVIGRTVEDYTLQELIRRAENLGYRQVIGEYRPTAKNALVSDLYSRLGFSQIPDATNRYVLTLPGLPIRTFVRAAPSLVRAA